MLSYFTPRLFLCFCLPCLAILGCQGYSSGEKNQAIARVVSHSSDLIGGPLAQGRAGDFLIKNKHLRAIIQQVETPVAPLGQSGGNLIDLDVTRRPNEAGYDQLGELVFWHSLGRAGKAQSVRIVDNGNVTGRAIIETMATDVRLTSTDLTTLAIQINATAAQSVFSQFDPDQPVTIDIRTRYSLGSDDRSLRIETTIINQSSTSLELPVGDLIWVNGTAQPFFAAEKSIIFGQPSQGFGLADASDEVGYNGVEYAAWQDEHVAYAFQQDTMQINTFAGQSTCFMLTTALACLAGSKVTPMGLTALTNAWPGQNAGFLRVPPRGQGVAVYRRYIAAASNLATATAALAINRAQPMQQLTLKVSDTNNQVVNQAVVAVLAPNDNGLWLPRSVAQTNEQGLLTLEVPSNSPIKILVQKSGYANANASRLPAHIVGQLTEQPSEPLAATLGLAGQVEFYTQNNLRQPLAARVLVLGQDASPEQLFTIGSELTLAGSSSDHAIYPFSEQSRDPLPQAPSAGYALQLSAASGLTAAHANAIAIVDTNAQGIARFNLDPGDYFAVASRGPSSDIAVVSFSVNANQTARVLLTVPVSIDRFGWIEADFGVRSSNSFLSSLNIEQLPQIAAAEGLDVLVVSDQNFITRVENTEYNLLINTGASTYIPGLGSFSAMPLNPAPIPIRSKPVTVPAQVLDPETLDGGAPAWFDTARRTLIGLAGWVEQILARTDIQKNSILGIEWPNRFFERIGLSFAFALGYNAEPVESGAIKTTQTASALYLSDSTLFDNRFAVLHISANQPPAERWRTLNYAFAFWNLGRRTPLVGSSLARQRFNDGVGQVRTLLRHPSGDQLIFAPGIDNFISLARDATLAGHSIVSNGPFATLAVQGTLWDTSDPAQPTLLDQFAAVGPGDLLTIKHNKFPSDHDFELMLTATVSVQAAPWAVPRVIELFINAPYQNPASLANDNDGNFLAAVTSARWLLTEPDLTAALTNASYRIVNSDNSITTVTSSTKRYQLERAYTWTISGSDLLTHSSDLWVAARLIGDRPLAPLLASVYGPVKAFAIVNPVFVDLTGDIGVDFDTAYTGPCEIANASKCPQ